MLVAYPPGNGKLMTLCNGTFCYNWSNVTVGFELNLPGNDRVAPSIVHLYGLGTSLNGREPQDCEVRGCQFESPLLRANPLPRGSIHLIWELHRTAHKKLSVELGED